MRLLSRLDTLLILTVARIMKYGINFEFYTGAASVVITLTILPEIQRPSYRRTKMFLELPCGNPVLISALALKPYIYFICKKVK